MTKADPVVHPDLLRYLNQVEDARNFCTRLMEGLSDRQVSWRPEPGRWSIGENIDHLVIIGAQYLYVIDEMVSEGVASNTTGTDRVRYGAAGYLIKWMEPPVTTRVPTPRPFRPGPAHDGEMLLHAFASLQDYLDARIRTADGLDLNRLRAASPIVRFLRMSLGQWLAFILAHQRRHLWAAFRVKEHPLFPPA